MNRTTCPLCGAPASVNEADARLYKYEPEDVSIAGYNLRQLRIVAELLESHKFTPADLREIETNLSTAMDVVRAELEKVQQHLINEALSHFQAPPDIDLPLPQGKALHVEHMSDHIHVTMKEADT